MRLFVQTGVQNKHAYLEFQGQLKAHQTPRQTKCFTHTKPQLQAICFQGATWLKRKENAFQDPHLHHQTYLCCHHISTSWLENINSIPFQGTKQSMHTQNCLTFQDRLTHVQMLFTWNHSPLLFSKLLFEHLLLPPRSAARAVPPRFTPKASSQTVEPPLSLLIDTFHSSKVLAARVSAIHSQGQSIQQVSCYKLLSGFRLP